MQARGRRAAGNRLALARAAKHGEAAEEQEEKRQDHHHLEAAVKADGQRAAARQVAGENRETLGADVGFGPDRSTAIGATDGRFALAKALNILIARVLVGVGAVAHRRSLSRGGARLPPMAAAQSSMLHGIGSPLPEFSLPNKNGAGVVSSADFTGRGLLVAFVCNHCPFVTHVEGLIRELCGECDRAGIGLVLINSNDPKTYAEDAPQHMGPHAKQAGWTCPYCWDESQDVARAFGAACTPDWFLYDREHRLHYRGQACPSTPRNGVPLTGSSLKQAIAGMVAGAAPPASQQPSIGCSVKWRG